MNEELILRKIDLGFERKILDAFLSDNSLTPETDIDTAYGLFDEDDRLFACGCAAGKLLKCFAVDPSLRGQNALGLLIGALTEDRFSLGLTDLFVITRKKNEALFTSSGFYPLARTDTLLMLENRRNGPERFIDSCFIAGDAGKVIGTAVMNCNPFTCGHRYLIESAAKECDVLYVFVVEEDRSLFPFSDRLRLVREGTRDLENVRVCPGGPYMISYASFPKYFLKKEENAAALSGTLDAVLFAERIAPALHASVRFVGAEPIDPVTAAYNGILKAVLPVHDISVREFPRLLNNGQVISASSVRALLEKKDFALLRALVPEHTFRYLKENYS